MKDLTLTSLTGPIVKILRRSHLTIFVVLLVGGLAVAVFMLNAVLAQSSDTSGYVAPSTNTRFDQTTIDQVNALKTSDDDTSSEFVIPDGARVNPF